MTARIDENQNYYGQALAARQIVRQMQGANPGADPLRDVLTRNGAGGGAPAEAAPPAPAGYAPPYQQPGGAYPPPGGSYSPPYQQQPAPSYQQPPAQSYQPPPAAAPSAGYGAAPSGYRPPPTPPAPAYQAPAQSGYQPPPGQYTYPPTSGGGPIQEQNLPPPPR